MNAKILVAAHKPYRMPDDELYYPVQAGAVLSKQAFGFSKDDTGDNISAKNPQFSELTVLYWGWKNLECDYLGLVHYRRHFSRRKAKGDVWNSDLTAVQAKELLCGTDVLLPKKRHYWIETLSSHYGHTHDATHLDALRSVIGEESPDYLPVYDRVMQQRSAHMFNMFLMKRDVADAYCSWLFKVLFRLENEIDATGLDSFDARLFGRVSEFLLDVWLEKNEIQYKEVGVVYTEPVNYGKKIAAFLRAKFGGKKYKHSF